MLLMAIAIDIIFTFNLDSSSSYYYFIKEIDMYYDDYYYYKIQFYRIIKIFKCNFHHFMNNILLS